MPQLSGRRQRLVLAGVLALSMIPATVSAATPAVGRRLALPTSRLGRSEAEPPFVCAQLAFGGGFEHGNGHAGYGVAVVFRPAAGSDFLDFLYDWNTGLVLQAERLGLGGKGRVLSADLLLRRYLADRGDERTSILPFLGAGPGASSAWPGVGDDAPGLKYWSLVLEGGQEWRYARGHLLVIKGQVRILRQDGVDWTTWSVQAGLGLPFPW
ncbi:MAG: hypothetical protein IPK64_08410 [bacterium]|nr:hypothetical protein [bacterium]